MFIRSAQNFKKIVSVYLLLGGCALFALLYYVYSGPQPVLRDFGSYYTAARIVFQKNGNIYNFRHSNDDTGLSRHMRMTQDPVFKKTREMTGSEGEANLPGYVFPYFYPPLLAYVLHPVSYLNKRHALAFWFTLLTLAIFLLPFVAAKWLSADNENFRELFLPGILTIFMLGFTVENNFHWRQVNILIALGVILTFLLQERIPILAGFFFATVVLIKMSPAIFVIYFLYRKNRRLLLYFVLWCLVLFGGTLLFDAWDYWVKFTGVIPDISKGNRMIRGLLPVESGANHSIKGFLSRVVLLKATTLEVVSILASLILLIYAWLRAGRNERELGPLPEHLWFLYRIVILALLASPMTWFNHYIMLYPAIFILLVYLWKSDLSTPLKLGIALSVFVILYPWFSAVARMRFGGWLALGLLNSIGFYGLVILFFLPDILGLVEKTRRPVRVGG